MNRAIYCVFVICTVRLFPLEAQTWDQQLKDTRLLAPETLQFHCPVRIVEIHQFPMLHLSDPGTKEEIDFSWPDTVRRLPALEMPDGKNQVYDFTVTRAMMASGMRAQCDIDKISLNGYSLYDRTTCEVHQKAMDLKPLPLRYGMIVQEDDPPDITAMRAGFPHSQVLAGGGCEIFRGMPVERLVYICPDCVAARAKWYADNPQRGWWKQE